MHSVTWQAERRSTRRSWPTRKRTGTWRSRPADVRGQRSPARRLLAHIRSRVHLLPRLRQRLLYPPLGWAPPSGSTTRTSTSTSNLRRILHCPRRPTRPSSRISSARCWRATGPRQTLWELILARASRMMLAIVYKTHHAMADGISPSTSHAPLRRRAEVEPARDEAPWKPPGTLQGRLGKNMRAPESWRRCAVFAAGCAGPPTSRSRPPPRRRRHRRGLGGDLEPGPAGAEGPFNTAITPNRGFCWSKLRAHRLQTHQERARRHRPTTSP